MKKLISCLLVLALMGSMLASVCLLTQAEGDVVTPQEPTAQPITPVSPSPSSPDQTADPTPSSDPTTAPTTEPTTAPTTDPATDPTTAPSQATDPSQSTTPSTLPSVTPPGTTPVSDYPNITKHPYGENVKEGDYAEFVARADGCSSIIWHILSPDGTTDILAEQAPSRFSGLIVSGINTERLGLNRIPQAMNGWQVRAEFVGAKGNVLSDLATIYVSAKELTAPTITGEPASVSLQPNEATVLRVTAAANQSGNTLTYQWYRNTVNSNVGGKAILGATMANYTPEYIEGTTYYYCAVRSSSGTDISPAAKTQCAAVTYLTVQEQTSPTTIPAAATDAATEAVTETEEPTEEETLPLIVSPRKSNTLLVIIIAVIIAITVLGIVATVLILKFYPGSNGGYDEPDMDDYDYLDDDIASSAVSSGITAARKPAPAPERPASKESSAELWDDSSAAQPGEPKPAADAPSGTASSTDPEWAEVEKLLGIDINFDDL